MEQRANLWFALRNVYFYACAISVCMSVYSLSIRSINPIHNSCDCVFHLRMLRLTQSDHVYRIGLNIPIGVMFILVYCDEYLRSVEDSVKYLIYLHPPELVKASTYRRHGYPGDLIACDMIPHTK